MTSTNISLVLDSVAPFAIFFLGLLSGAIAAAFLILLLARPNRKRAEKQRQADKEELKSRTDLSPLERGTYEVKIDRAFARELDRIDRQTATVGKLLTVFGAVGGLFGLIYSFWKEDLLSKLFYMFVVFIKTSFWNNVVTGALAAEGVKPDIAPFVPFIASGILALMGLSFIIALITLLLLKDIPENQARIKAADNIVKTFGGFFTGLATTLLK